MCLGVHRHYHDTGGFPVQPVHNACIGVLRPCPAFETIPVFGRFPCNAEEAVLLGKHENVVIRMQDCEPGSEWRLVMESV